MRYSTLLVLGALSLPFFGVAKAQSPGVAVFSYLDSVAVTIEQDRLITAERIDKLNQGYPLTFTIEITLKRDSKFWRDETVTAYRLRFRVLHREWDGLLDLKFSGSDGRFIQRQALSPSDLEQELEDKLLLTLCSVNRLDSVDHYFVEVAVGYRNLGPDDVQGVQDWLETGETSPKSDSTSLANPSLGKSFVDFLWDLSGLAGQTERYSTSRFRISELRRGD